MMSTMNDVRSHRSKDSAASATVNVSKIRFRQGNHSDFHRTTRRRVREYFDAAGKSRFADRSIYAKGALYASLAATCYGLILFGGFGPWPMLGLAIGFGVLALLLSINVAHDAAHDALAPNRTVNRIVQTLSFILLGADPYLWRLRHVKSHHTFPNVNGCDIDIDSNFFLRLSPNHPRRWHQRAQHLYAPFIFWLVDIDTVFFKDIQYLFRHRLANMVDITHPRWAYAMFFVCKAAYLSIVMGIPLLVLPVPWWQVIVGWMVMSLVSSTVFVYLLIGTHFAEETAFPELDEDGIIDHDWAIHAMVTSLDWNPCSRLALFFGGGANAHAAHHLFPNVSHAHYIPITRIIARTAAEFGIRHNVTTLPRMVRSHFRFLRNMARLEARPAGTRMTSTNEVHGIAHGHVG
jgi:linoleoyl-CoA desaturase